jgi:hypothetical protein
VTRKAFAVPPEPFFSLIIYFPSISSSFGIPYFTNKFFLGLNNKNGFYIFTKKLKNN